MKIKEIRRIVTEDFPNKYKDLVGPLAFAINPFLESVINALNRQLTFKDNFNAQEVDLEVRTPITTSSPVTLRTTIRGRCIGILCIKVLNLDNNSATLDAAPFVDFVQVDETTIQIKKINGLTDNTRYQLKLILLGG